MFDRSKVPEHERTLLLEDCPFRLIRRLGAGGMGEVHLAEDGRLRRKVALKFVLPELAGDRERLMRFEREALAAAALNHPNVATIYGVGEMGGRRYIAMEYVEGMSLAEHLASRHMELGEVIAIGIDLAEALQEAHAKGIVHRDVKPSNVMVTSRGHAKVLDFGIAKLGRELEPEESGHTWLGRETSASGLLGTASYMSPEQAQGLPADARSDIFCLGVTLYEMATGRRPFEGPTKTAILQLTIEADAAPVRRHDPWLPARFERVVSRCLVKDRERRYQTAGDLLSDLRAVQRRLGESLRGGSRPANLRHSARRRAAAARPTAALVIGSLS